MELDIPFARFNFFVKGKQGVDVCLFGELS